MKAILSLSGSGGLLCLRERTPTVRSNEVVKEIFELCGKFDRRLGSNPTDARKNIW